MSNVLEPLEPIAIVGMGCRLPGGIQSPSSFWELLVNGKNAITEIPSNRWNRDAYYSKDRARAGKLIGRAGGFLEAVDLFEPRFFGISEAEAPHLDPQQRLLLEVTWEGFERAGLLMEDCRGGPVGVFIGCFTADYLHMQFADPYEVGAYTATGALSTMLAARISHTFDFRGPSMTVDTACSSSLHCVHLACESLRSGDSDIAVAGGSQLTLIPEFNIAETKAGFLSAESQCRAFDAGAHGYVRSEGVGVVVLKRLRDARAAGDPIQAVILGSAINQDGRTPSIAQPNLLAQQDVMRRACARAGVPPAEICYVEAHGTGTSAGDRAEAEAIGTVFRVAPGCSSELLVGSCKSNIGHTEAAAGIAGLIKAALCVKHRAVPPNLHFETPNPAIGFEHLRLRVPVKMEPLTGEPLVACINSFGFGGSNAAVVIRAPQHLECAPPHPPHPAHKSFLLPMSARSTAALQGALAGMEAWLRNSPEGVDTRDLCYTAGVRRAHAGHRRAFVFSDVASLQAQISSLTGNGHAESRTADAPGKGTVWVFSGAGNQRFQTGLQLFREEAVFRGVLEQCDEIYRGLASFSLLELMRSRPSGEHIQEAWLAHPVTVSIQLGLASLYRSWGVEPAAIVGHSLGESAACCVAGIYSVEQALQLVFHRCECLKPLHGTGGLLAVAADEEAVEEALGVDFGECAVAAINGPQSITLSAGGTRLESVREQLSQVGIRCQFLTESFACHHRYPALQAAVQKLEEQMRQVRAQAPHTLLFSTVTGDVIDVPPSSSYWASHLLESVKLREVISKLARQGFRRFLELGPYPALSAAIAATLDDDRTRVLSSLHPGRDERSSLLHSIGGLYESGERIDWRKLYPSGNVLDLPTYQWQRSSFWREPEVSVKHRMRPPASHLLGERIGNGHDSWRTEVSVERFPYLLDHRIAGQAVLPAAAYVDMALCAGREHFGGHPFVVEDLRFLKAISLNRDSAFFMEFHLDGASGTFCIFATPGLTVPSAERVAEGKMRSLPPGIDVPRDPPVLHSSTDDGVSGEQLYELFAQRRYDYHGAFRGIERAFVNGDRTLCEIALPSEVEISGYSFHPAALDAAFQALLCIRDAGAADVPATHDAMEIPDSIGSIRVFGTPTRRMLVWARIRDTEAGHSGELRIFDKSRQLVARIQDFSTRRVESKGRSGAAGSPDSCLYKADWQSDEFIPATLPAGSRSSQEEPVWVILSDAGDAGDRFTRSIMESGAARVLRGSWRPEFAEILNREPSLAGVIHLGNLDLTNALSSSSETCCASVLSLARALSLRDDNCKLWVVTRGAHRITPLDPPADPFQAASWGLARAIGQREMPRIWGGLIDLSHDCLQGEIDGAVLSIVLPGDEDQLAFRDRDRFVLRLRRMTAQHTPAPKIAFRENVAYIVTGAFGALGGEVARWMVARGARRLILPSRREAQSNSLVAELESVGAVVELVVLDLSNAGQVSAYCKRRQREPGPPIHGVIYCAGRSRDQLAATADNDAFDEVFDAKAAGAWALHQSLRAAPLEHFVLFSSVASILPNPGMGAYAAANRFLDVLANHRRSLGLPGLSIAWGPWEIGMTERGGIKEYLDRAGFRCFNVQQGMRLLELLWHSEYPEPIAVSVDWRRASTHGYLRLPILKDTQLELDARATLPLNGDSSRISPGAESNGHAASAEERLWDFIGRLISTNKQLDLSIPLVEQGLDSLGATVLIETLYREFGVSVQPDALADGLSVQGMMDILSRVQPAG